jgi:hypothetical protein
VGNKSLRFFAGGCLAVWAVACAETGPLRRRPEGDYQIAGPNYQVGALPGGKLMPDGWILKNYREHEGAFSPLEDKLFRHDLVFTREQDDGSLRMLKGGPVPCDWDQMPTYCLLVGHSDRRVKIQPNQNLRFVVSAQRPHKFAGVEGVETVVDGITAADNAPLWRVYQLWFHDAAKTRFVLLTFQDTPAAFASAIADVTALAERISFP